MSASLNRVVPDAMVNTMQQIGGVVGTAQPWLTTARPDRRRPRRAAGQQALGRFDRCRLVRVDPDYYVHPRPGTLAKSGQSLRMARRAVRLQAQVRSAAAMLVAPLMQRRPIAVLRSVSITRGAFPVLTVGASSR